jgi:hypothetical protein
MLSIKPLAFTEISEIIKRSRLVKIYEEDFIEARYLNAISNTGAGTTENLSIATTANPFLIGGRTIILGTVAGAASSRINNLGRTIVPGRWQINIVGLFSWSPANATPLITHVNSTELFMGLHFLRYSGVTQTAGIGFQYNNNGAGIFVANNGATSTILPSTNLFLAQNVPHSFQLVIHQNTPKVDLFVNNDFVVSATGGNIPTYNSVSRAMNSCTDVRRVAADAVNLPVRYTLDHYAILLEQL